MWSSRESLAAQLVALLKDASRESIDLRGRILSLLGIFGSKEQLPLLRELIFDPLEPFRIRINALRVATRLGLTLSGHEFMLLRDELAQGEAFALGLALLFDVARLESFDDIMKEALLGLSPGERCVLLGAQFRVPQPPAMEAWLFEQWYQSDRHTRMELEVERSEMQECNVAVAFAQRGRPEAWRLLREWSEELSDARMERLLWPLYRRSREEVARLADASAAFHPFAARRLLLPLDALRAHWGDAELLRRLDRVVQAANVACIVPRRLVARPKSFARAVELLGEWEFARRRVLYRRLCDFTMALEVRFDLWEQLRKVDPSTAARWVLVAWRYPENEDLVRRILGWVSEHGAVPEDRPVLLALLREPDAALQRQALSALLSLGESGPGWVDRLQSLAHAESRGVRALALAGLVQNGQREALEPLRRMAVDEPEYQARSDALRWLGVLDVEGSRQVFVNVLSQGGSQLDGHASSAREERLDSVAWDVLSRRGEDDDLSLLLELRLDGSFTQSVDNHFRHHLARKGGEPVTDWPPRNTSDGWCELCLMYC